MKNKSNQQKNDISIIINPNKILILNFKGNIKLMNEILDPISNIYEGELNKRIGHNFPSTFIPNNNHLLSQYKSKCDYVIGISNIKDLNHELAHAKFYLDSDYKRQIIDEWENLNNLTRTHIYNFLKKLGYSDSVIIDEYQAYKSTEKNNFFGTKL